MVLHIQKVMLVLLVAMLLLSCGSGVRDVGSSVPDVESMDFNHEVYTGEFFYSERNLQGRDYVINLKDIKYEKQNLTTAAQAVDYMIAVMADENTPFPLRITGGVVYELWYDPTAGIWCATVTTQKDIDEMNDKYHGSYILNAGPAVYFRYDGKFLYFAPQE